jgi:hypothetical protein
MVLKAALRGEIAFPSKSPPPTFPIRQRVILGLGARHPRGLYSVDIKDDRKETRPRERRRLPRKIS